MKEYFINDHSKIKNADVLVNKLDYFETAKHSVKSLHRNSHHFEDR